ncbi:retrotransposon hot spot (RHS) protein, putative, partial [Trypanosoma cruzi]
MKGRQPSTGLPCKGWGMIVVTSPNIKNFEWWAMQMGAEQIIIDCPKESDVRAMCIWKEHNGQVEEEEEEEEETKEEAKEEADEEAEEEPEEEEEEESEEEADEESEEEPEEESEEEAEEEADFWKRVEKRMNKVGPILRFIFNGKKCKSRVRACKFAVNNITASMLQYYTGIGTGKSCNGHHVSHKLVKVVRVREKDKIESSLNLLISPLLERKTLSKMESE